MLHQHLDILASMCRVPAISPHICSLPSEILSLIFDAVDLGGGSKKDVWAIMGSCKTLQQALVLYPAEIKLGERWSQSQLAGSNSLDSNRKIPGNQLLPSSYFSSASCARDQYIIRARDHCINRPELLKVARCVTQHQPTPKRPYRSVPALASCPTTPHPFPCLCRPVCCLTSDD